MHSTGDISGLASYIQSIASQSGGNAKIRSSTYVGNGSSSRTITIGIRPYVVFIYFGSGTGYNVTGDDGIIMTSSGFRINSETFNRNGVTNTYVAIGV